MIESSNYQHVERRAWTIMIVSFVAFCVAVSAALFVVRWFLFESETTQVASIALISGDVDFTPPGASLPTTLSQSVTNIAENTRLDTEAGSQAAVSFHTFDQAATLGSLQVYGGSSLNLSLFRSPQFEWSSLPHRMEVVMQRGRARVSLAVDAPRQIVILLKTPHGEVRLDRPGSYSIEVTSQNTEVVVREGAATVSKGEQSIILASGERTTLKPGSETGLEVETGERNLILNGDFSAPLSPSDWSFEIIRVNVADILGRIERTVDAGRNVVHFVRTASGPGRVGIAQNISRDVRDYSSLRLHLAIRIVNQSLFVCGSAGSECPLMVKIEYVDRAGGENEWLQGFFYRADANNALPRLCVYCPPPQTPHTQIQQDVWYAYDSPDLITLLNKPSIIRAITIYAEGHTFESYVSEIELQAGD